MPIRKLPLGVRQNNPGNIEKGDDWRGLAPVQEHPRFATFTAPLWGIRAIARIMLAYRRKGFRTPRAIIGRWAPHTDDPNPAVAGDERAQPTEAYIRNVAHAVGADPDDEIDVARREVMLPLVAAIIRQEVGTDGGKDWYEPGVIASAVDLALAKG